KFKPLFAPLILDLDGRINLNVHGNIRGKAGNGNAQHASNQGWGPWEVNLQPVLSMSDPVTNQLEWPQLFTGVGGPSPLGRYNQDGHPHSQMPINMATPGNSPHVYAQVDFDGCDEVNGYGPTTQFILDLRPYEFPTNSKNYFCTTLPSYLNPLNNNPYVGFGNGSPTERQDHPLLYNFFNPQRSAANPRIVDTAFAISNME